MMKRTFLLLGVAALLTACPATNSVEIQNLSRTENTPDSILNIIQVAIERSGSAESNVIDLSDDPIGPRESQEFCCYTDGTYDVRVVAVFETGVQDENLAPNNEFVGPRTHVFLVFGDDNNVRFFTAS